MSQSLPSPSARKKALEWIEKALTIRSMSEYDMIGNLMRSFGIRSQTAVAWIEEVKKYYLPKEAEK